MNKDKTPISNKSSMAGSSFGSSIRNKKTNQATSGKTGSDNKKK